MDSIAIFHSLLVALFTVLFFFKAKDYLWGFWHTEKETVKVLVTGAAGEIGYAIVPMIARGIMLGAIQPVILHMLDKDENKDALEEVKMELFDAAFPLLKGVVATTVAEEACKDVDVAVMIGVESVSTFKAQVSALEKHAKKNCKVLVVTTPANANVREWRELATSIPQKNITYLTRLEHNRALGQIAKIAAEKEDVHVSDVKNVIIWGNDDKTQYPDVHRAIVTTINGEKDVKEYVADDNRMQIFYASYEVERLFARLKSELNTKRKAGKRSSALSTASSACDHVHDWLLGTPEGTWVSMGVHSDGSYGIPVGRITSFPVTCDGREWSTVKGLPGPSDETKKKPIVDKKEKGWHVHDDMMM